MTTSNAAKRDSGDRERSRSKKAWRAIRLAPRRVRLALRMGGRNLERLKAEIDVTGALRHQLFVSDHQPAIERLLDQANRAAEDQDLEAGWKALNGALSLRYASMEEERDRRAAAEVLRAEIKKKAGGSWREAAVCATVGRRADDEAPSARALTEAQMLLSEHSANVYRRLDMFGVILAWTTVTLMVALVVFLVGVDRAWFPDLTRPFDEVTSTAGVMVLGALGALVSTATGAVAGSRAKKLPEISFGLTVALIRPVLGAASAVLLVVVLVSGIQDTISIDGAKLWVFAVAAGFSERLLTRTLATVESAVSR